jgi:hypothetical protein
VLRLEVAGYAATCTGVRIYNTIGLESIFKEVSVLCGPRHVVQQPFATRVESVLLGGRARDDTLHGLGCLGQVLVGVFEEGMPQAL